MRSVLAVGLLLFLVAGACKKTEASAPDVSNTASPSSAAPCDNGQSGEACKAQSASAVTKIIFVGKEHACDCTRKRVEAGWSVLHKVLGTPPKVLVERLQVDTETSKVDPFQRMRPMMVLPALYFLDSKGVLIELLQGDITEAQVAAILGR